MPRPSPFHRTCAILLLLAARLAGETQPQAGAVRDAAVDDQPPGLNAAAGSPWEVSETLRASVGWRENATVSSVQSINRPFWRAEAELFVIRPLGEQAQFISFLTGDVLRYVNPPPDVAGEQQWAGDLQVRWQPLPSLRASLKGVGFLQDTFIDPSVSEGLQQPATWVRLWGVYSTLAPRLKLPWGFALEPSFQARRIGFRRGYAGDYNESRPGVTVEWKRSDMLVLSASWYLHQRHYLHLHATTAGGRPLANRLLRLEQHEGELRASSTFNAAGRWTIGATVGRLENRDQAFGFLDYDQDRAALQIDWEHAAWRVSAGGTTRRLDYLHQTVGFGISPTARIAEVFEVDARVEHDLGGRWTAFAEHAWERNRSNITDDPIYRFSYRTNTVQVGLQREF